MNKTQDIAEDVVKSADRTLDVIELLSSWGREMSHTQLVEMLRIPKSSLTKLLRNLLARDYVQFNAETKCYRVGDALLKLARQSSQQKNLVGCAEKVLPEILQQTSESCALNQLKGDQIEVVAALNGGQRLVAHMRVGDLAPLYAVSGGKVVLAHLPERMRAEYLQSVRYVQHTPKTIASTPVLALQLEEIRRSGVAYSFEEYTPGIVGVAVAILSASDYPLGSLNVTLPAVRYDEAVARRAIEALQAAAGRVTRLLSMASQ